MAGIGGLAGARWEICGKSPTTEPEHFCHSNLGGKWGAQLKFAGYDGLVVRGKSDKPVYLYIRDDIVEIKDASALWGKGAIAVRETLKNELGDSFSVVTTGPAGDNMVTLANLLADNDASGASGFGAVMGSKKLKSIAVSGSGKVAVAQPDRLRQLTRHIQKLKRDIPDSEFGLVSLPQMKRDRCYGCPGGCQRAIFEATDGQKGKFMCQSAHFYREPARKYYGEQNEVPFHANRLCNEYGLDTIAVYPIIRWLSRCHKAGILTDQNTGIPLSKIGSLEFMECLVKKISLRDGFGDTLAHGVFGAANLVGAEARGLITDYVIKGGGYTAGFDPRIYITTALLYVTEARPLPIQFGEVTIGGLLFNWLGWVNKIEGGYVSSEVIRSVAKRFFGSELAVDFSTYAGKALAAKMIQDRESVKHSLILCSYMWPITSIRHSEDHVGDPTMESKVYSAVTGKEADEEGLYKTGEAIFNLQRAMLVREGHNGIESDILPEYFFNKPAGPDLPHNPDCLVPGKDGEIISRKGSVLSKQEFENMRAEYYELRGWNVATGLQTTAKLMELGLRDIAADLEQKRLKG
jgi:aldehyde:ferredoxin oxidoreductase